MIENYENIIDDILHLTFDIPRTIANKSTRVTLKYYLILFSIFDELSHS